MALPLILLGTIATGLLLKHEHKQALQRQDIRRTLALPDDLKHIGREPSDSHPSNEKVAMVPGAIICCGVYGAFVHVGIAIDDNNIIELHGNGLVRAISRARFIDGRSGERLFIACDKNATALCDNDAADRAIRQLYSYRNYHVLKHNCYYFISEILTGKAQRVTTFDDFNMLLKNKFNSPVYWDEVV